MFISGLDLGCLQDHTALVTIERQGSVMGVRRAHRWPLMTPYTQVVEDLKAMFDKEPLRGSRLIVDRTGVGVAVVDFISAAGIPAAIEAWTITAAREPNEDKSTVPKADLVAAVQVGLGTGSLLFAEGLRYGPLLSEELKAFRSKVTEARNEVYSAREGANDDLVLALALA